MNTTIQVRQRGVFTLPSDLRSKYNIKDGDTFRVIDLDGIFVLTPLSPIAPELAREIEQARLEAGMSTEELLQGLREQRKQYYAEKYASEQSAE